MKMSLLEQLLSQQSTQQNPIAADSIVIESFDPVRRRKALTDLEGPLEPLFYAKHPTTLLVADMPPALGGQPRKVPLAEYCKEEKFTWVGTPLIHQKRRHKLFEIPTQTCVETHALQYWFHGKNDLLIANLDVNHSETSGASHETLEHIVKISDLKVNASAADGSTVENYAAAAGVVLPSKVKVGKGVFYYPASKSPLKIGTCVGLYSGVIQSSAENAKFYPYGFRAGQDQDPSNLFAQNYATGFFDAQEYGDYTRFFQHAPTEAELAQIRMPNHLKALVATANLLPTCGIHTPIPTITFITRRNIEPNEQLLYSYGDYWKDMHKSNSGGSYALFDLVGEIIGTVDINNKFTVNKMYQHDGKKPAPRCDSRADLIAPNQLQANTAINNDYREIFLENIRFIVNFHANRKTPAGTNFYSKAELAFIARMQDLCKSNDPEHVLYKMDDIREDISKKSQAKNLLALSLELCGHMMYYQCQRGLVASAQKQLMASQHKPAQPLHVAKLDQPVINAIYRSLKAATGNNKWQIDSQQNFCLVASKDSLEPIRKHLTEQGLQPVVAPFPNTEDYCLRVKAAHLNNKELKPIQSSAISSVQQAMVKK
jgi:hypothetical protein